MKRLWLGSLTLVGMLCSSWAGAAEDPLFKWVKDKEVTSAQALKKSQYERVLPFKEEISKQLVTQVLLKDLAMQLSDYLRSRRQLEAQTTADSVLPERFDKEGVVELFDQDYRYVLEIRFKPIGKRTKVSVIGRPVYRIPDPEAMAALGLNPDGEETGSDSSVEVKIKGSASSRILLGPITVEPIEGKPQEYGVKEIIDEGKQKSAQLVQAFIHFLDIKNKEAQKKGVKKVLPEALPSDHSLPGTEENQPKTVPEGKAEGSEVDVKIKTQ